MYIQFPGVLPVFSDPAIVPSIFMLWFIFVIACDLFEWKPFIVYLHIQCTCIVVGDPVIRKGGFRSH